MKENACGCCYMTSNIPMDCSCQWCHTDNPIPVELPDELKSSVVIDNLSRFKPIAWASEFTDGWQFFEKKS